MTAAFGRMRFEDSEIAEHVESAWSVALRPEPVSKPLYIPADGRVEVIWTERGIVAGGHVTKPIVTDPAWPSTIYGVQLKVGRAGALLGTAGHELVDAPLLLSDIWGRDGDLLAERVAEARTPQAKIDALLEGLAAHARNNLRPDAVIDHVAARAADPASRVPEIAGQLGFSERQLRRRFHDAVGFGPKLLQRIERFQRFVRVVRTPGAGADLARVAADLGYSDQSHLARDSRELAGTAPGALVGPGV